MNDEDRPGGAARPPRQRTLLKGSLRREGRPEAIEIRIRNLSSGGLMASCTEAIACGARVTVTLREIGEVSGAVVWGAADGIGIAFDEPIDPLRVLQQPVKPQPPQRFVPTVERGARRPGLRVR